MQNGLSYVRSTLAATVIALVALVGVATAFAAPEFKGSFLWDGPIPQTFNEAPMLAAQVAAGELPPVEDRLPVWDDVLVIPVVERIGDYGGTWRRGHSGGPGNQGVDRLMMDHVLLFDLDGAEVIPNVLKSWQVSADERTFTMQLRRGMKWNDGTPFTADAFVWPNVNIVRNDELNPAKEGRLGFSQFGPKLRKIDDYTIQWSFDEPAAGFIDELATFRIGGWTFNGRVGAPAYAPGHWLQQFHQDLVSDKAALDNMIKDSGFDNWESFFKAKMDVHVTLGVPTISPWVTQTLGTEELYVLERNPYYYAVDPAGNQLPYIDRIQHRPWESREVLQLRAIAGEIDFQQRDISFDQVPVFLENADKGDYRVMFWPTDGSIAVPFNYSYGLGDVAETPDPEIRKWITNRDFKIALSHAINRPKINEIVFFGTGVEKQAAFGEGHPHYPGEEIEKLYTEYDPDKANAILDRLGLDQKDDEGFRLRSDGNGRLKLEFIDTGGPPWKVSTGALIVEDWAKVGIDVNYIVEAWPVFSEREGGNMHQISRLDIDVNARTPTSPVEGRHAFPGYQNWYAGRKGARLLGSGAVAVEPPPDDADFWRLVELSDEAANLPYADRTENYIETQKIGVENLYVIGVIGNTPAFGGVIIAKNNFRNVPERAKNVSELQNPGTGRTVQFFFEGGRNDSE